MSGMVYVRVTKLYSAAYRILVFKGRQRNRPAIYRLSNCAPLTLGKFSQLSKKKKGNNGEVKNVCKPNIFFEFEF